MNKTISTFDYPNSLVCEYKHWVVLLRPKQISLGCLILAFKGTETSFSTIGSEGFLEFEKIIKDIEKVLSLLFDYNKINYLMLMMVDPHVHFHVIPRYSAEKEFAGTKFSDPAWPSAPDLGHKHEISLAVKNELLKVLRQAWPL